MKNINSYSSLASGTDYDDDDDDPEDKCNG